MTNPTENHLIADGSGATRIGIVQQKGGVGKSTLAVNVSGALNERGNDVLLIDADPQGHLTSGVGLDDYYGEQPPSLYDALVSPHTFEPENGERSFDDIIVTEHEEFDVIPSNIDMFSLEQDLVTEMRGRERLREILDMLDHEYNFIIVDTPPSLGQITDNAVLATQNLLVPVEAEDTSIRALDLLNRQIDTLEGKYDVNIIDQAVVANNVHYPLDKEQQGMMEWFEKAYDGICPVFEIRNRVVIKRAWNNGVSVFNHDEDCDQKDELLNIAKELENIDAPEVAQ